MRILACTSLLFFAGAASFCQSDGKLPEFEVASIKPAPPPSGGNLRVRMGGDPGRIDMANITLKDMIRQAYQVKEYQIAGPDWMNFTRFDVVAKIPPKTTKEQIPLMWQSLLADRFKLSLHRDQKELPVYVLVVGKNGPKLKESEESGNPPAPPGGGLFLGGGRGMMQMGRGRLTASRMNLAGFADLLSRQMDRPVVDQTGLAGSYDFSLEWTPDERQKMTFAGGVAGPPPGAEEHVRLGGPETAAPAGPTIFVALQEQLGLKMEARKSAVEILVIDHVEKAPTEN
jgi:uncharacterized protein (TIGR03435 family)